MKFSIKQMLAVGALAVAAGPALADVYTSNTNNGELVLFVQNQTQNTTYARGLQIRLDDIFTASAIQGDDYTVGKNVNFNLGTIGPDSNLAAFLSNALPTDTIVWSVVGGDGGNSNALAEERYITTTQSDLSGGTTVTNGQLRAAYSALDGIQANNNAFIAGTTLGDGSSTPVGSNAIYTSVFENWNGAGPHQASALGSAANFYLLSSAGGTTSNNARVYSLASLTLHSDGTLSAVPIPAAIWLLGSGLLGLAGVSRRKQVA